MLDLMRGIVQVLKDNDNLNFAVLTGCLRVSKESIFTGVNNFSTSSVISKNFNKYFGFTEEDVQGLLKDFGAWEQYPLAKVRNPKDNNALFVASEQIGHCYLSGFVNFACSQN